jgi:hypothetical protein
MNAVCKRETSEALDGEETLSSRADVPWLTRLESIYDCVSTQHRRCSARSLPGRPRFRLFFRSWVRPYRLTYR